MPPRKFVLDTNCFIDAASGTGVDAFDAFCAAAAPGLYLSTVVAAELRAGAGRNRAKLERVVLAPYGRRGRVVSPSPAAWDALGTALSRFVEREGLVLAQVRRSFVFDILIAYSCRELGAVLVSRNAHDLERIASVFPFDFVAPYPRLQ